MSEDQATIANQQEEIYNDPVFKEMVDAGLFFGRKRSRTNPRMRPYILANRNEMEIINLAKTHEGMEKAAEFLASTVRSGGSVLMVGTQPPAAAIQDLAKEFNFPNVVSRWLGGTLTNFQVINRRVEYFKKLKADWAKNAFEKYTKKEKLDIEREIADLEITLGGLEVMTTLPNIMVVVDANLHLTAVREARITRIPVIGFINTDSDPDLIDYPVVGNTKSRSSVNWFLQRIKDVILPARMAHQTAVAKESEKLQPKIAEIPEK